MSERAAPSTVHPLWRPFAPTANAQRQAERVAHRQTTIGPLVADEHHAFVAQFAELEGSVRRVLSARLLAIEHVGSTAVPGLLAKPVIDVDLTVADVEAEDEYLPDLEGLGWRLLFRDDVAGDPHRQLSLGAPNANLHVWAPGAVEPRRHHVFVSWLRSHPDDRDRYARVKTSRPGSSSYNDHKSALVYDIYERIFLADTTHHHDPQPRRSDATTVRPGR